MNQISYKNIENKGEEINPFSKIYYKLRKSFANGYKLLIESLHSYSRRWR